MAVLVGAPSRRVSTARALGCVKFGVATSDGQRLAVREQRQRVLSGSSCELGYSSLSRIRKL